MAISISPAPGYLESIDSHPSYSKCSSPPVDTSAYASLLQQCGNSRSLAQGRRLHALIVENGLDRVTFLCNLLVQMYGKCGSSDEARAVFDQILEPNVFSWTMIMAAYVQNDQWKDALKLFPQMDLDGIKPDKVIYLTILRACSTAGDLAEGKAIHARIVADGLESDEFVATSLVNMYGNCGSLEDAQLIFDRQCGRNVVLWNAMIAAWGQCGHNICGLQLLKQMDLEGVISDEVTFSSLLDACSSMECLAEGKAVHARISAAGFEAFGGVGTSLVTMYCKLGKLDDARGAFDKLSYKNVVSWTALIGGYVQHGHADEAFQLFRRMDLEGMPPNEVTYVNVLVACTNLRQGKAIHERISASKLEEFVEVGNSLVNMYGECGDLEEARRVFERIHRNVITWNVMVTAYWKHGFRNEAMRLLRRMDLEGILPNDVTFLAGLEACSNLKDGEALHDRVVARGFGSHVALANSLVNMYAKCGSLNQARLVFDKMHRRNVVSCTSLIAAYAQVGNYKDALHVYESVLLRQGITPDKIAFTHILDVCSNLGALAEGEMIHGHIVAAGLETDIAVANSLLNMYARCGNISKTQSLFDAMRCKDSISWTAIITAHAQHGHVVKALQHFWEMNLEGIQPEEVTLLSVLHACSHAGLVDEARTYFISMSIDHGLTISATHYRCMVDVFGRAGWLEDADDLLKNMPFQPGVVAWKSFLAACKMHSSVEGAVLAAKMVSESEPENSASYVMLSGTYATGRSSLLHEFTSNLHTSKHQVECLSTRVQWQASHCGKKACLPCDCRQVYI